MKYYINPSDKEPFNPDDAGTPRDPVFRMAMNMSPGEAGRQSVYDELMRTIVELQNADDPRMPTNQFQETANGIVAQARQRIGDITGTR